MRILFRIVLSLSCIGSPLLDVNVSRGRSRIIDNADVAECVRQDQIDKAVLSLSREYDEAQRAQNLLRRLSKVSSRCRQRVVATIIKAMDQPNIDISRDQTEANLWREGARLLGDLKATEALDLLLSHIKMTDGSWSNTMTHQPALGGIVRMGPIAVSKLEHLLQNEDWETRQYAVFCLAYIGGPLARRALQRALPMESHSCVKQFMTISIRTIDVEHGGVKPDHGELYNAFVCHS